LKPSKYKTKGRLVYKNLLLRSKRVISNYFILAYSVIPPLVNDIEQKERVGVEFGVTASKKVGNAVERNWCKRRIRILIEKTEIPDFNTKVYLNVIARRSMVKKKFSFLKMDFANCIKRLKNDNFL